MTRTLLNQVLSFIVLTLSAQAAGVDQIIYSDARQNGWEDWGWAQINYDSAQTAHSGTRAIAVTMAQPWQAIYLHHDAQNSASFGTLSFWIHGGPAGGQNLQIQGLLNGQAQTAVPLATLTANTWQAVTVSLEQLGVANRTDFDGFWIQDRAGVTQPTFYLDDIVLKSGSSNPPPITNAVPVTVTVNAALNRHPISAMVYGVAFASAQQLADLNSPVNRSGGNGESRYNWQINAHNHAADFYFESIADTPATEGAAGDDFVRSSKSSGAEPMMTIPMLDWAPKLGPNRGKLASYSTAKYGPQTDTDKAYFPTAGNGISVTNKTLITWNDPNDANVPVNSTFQQNWVQHLIKRWGTSQNGGVRYYFMDNEPSIWHSTHRDIHPTGAKMQEIRDKFVEYASKVKAVDPAALVAGPEEWGWSGYIYSGYDQQWGPAHNWSNLPDRAANGGMDYLPWLLDQLHKEAQASNRRLLDFFTVHYYPQSGEFGNDTSTAMQLLRNRSTRSLWDPNYVDASWINDKVKLVPRLKDWVAKYYPETKIGLTEYNWGAENHINGATAQADILGILGREGLDLATRWTTPAATTPTYKAIKMYRNYDDRKSTFGDTSVSSAVPDADKLSAFAALRSSDQTLTVMVVNKQLTNAAAISLALTNFPAGTTAQAWQLTSANAIAQLPGIPLTGNTLTHTVPAQSITLYVVPAAAGAPRLLFQNISPDGKAQLRIDGQPGESYMIQRSIDLLNWSTISTNTLAGASEPFAVSIDSAAAFFRTVAVP